MKYIVYFYSVHFYLFGEWSIQFWIFLNLLIFQGLSQINATT